MFDVFLVHLDSKKNLIVSYEKIIQFFIFLTFEISNGSKRLAYIRIKKMMIAVNLL